MSWVTAWGGFPSGLAYMESMRALCDYHDPRVPLYLVGVDSSKPAPLPEDWMRVAPGTDAAIWRPWSRETGEL